MQNILNINSIRHKFDEITFILNDQLADILILNETKLDEFDDDYLYQHCNYTSIRRDRLIDRGGGIIVFVKKSIALSNINVCDAVEIINLQFKVENSTYGLIACYRPPHTANELAFFDELEKVTDSLYNNSDDIFIVGDLNFDLNDPVKSCNYVTLMIFLAFLIQSILVLESILSMDIMLF